MRLLSEKNKDGVPDNACDRAVYFFIEGLIDNIRDDIPTAYDVDRVVVQIESIMDDETIRFCDQAVKKSVDIVKAGGVNE